MFGQSLVERSTFVREEIFGESVVRGDPATQIRQRLVSTGKGETRFYYPNEVKMAEKYFPALVKFVDGLYDELSNVSELNEDQALRFCAIVYNLGILVHPYIDGNGQTFRIIAESYLHELSANSVDKYFPFKVAQKPESQIRSVHTELIDRLPLSSDESPLSDVVAVQEFLKTMPTYDRESKTPADFSKWLENVREYLNDPELTPVASIEVLEKRLFEGYKRLGIEDEFVEEFGKKQKAFERQQLAHGYLGYILESPDSSKMHLEYILNGVLENDSDDAEAQAFSQMAFFTHNRTFSQMRAVLQGRQVHQIDFGNAIAKLKETKHVRR